MVGFQDSWLPSSHVHLDNLMRHNGAWGHVGMWGV
jgi:hypothetical protein